MEFSRLLNSVSGSFGLNSSDKLPSYLATTDGTVPRNFQSENWYTIPTSGLYQFAIESVDLADAGLNPVGQFVATTTALLGTNGEFTEFTLPITPQEITQTEDFAVSVKPTQGGSVVQHSGNRYKMLTISGTTGVAPYRGQLGVDRGTGIANNEPDELKFRSGYEVFQHFRAWMKSYHQTKAQGGARKKLRMVFRNFKDWEFLYVEPLKFVMKRDAQKPLLYNYTIQFKVLGHVKPATPLLPFLDTVDNVLNKSAKALNASRSILLKTQDLIVSTIGDIGDTLEGVRRVISAVRAAQRIPIGFGQISSRVLKKHLSNRDSIALAQRIGDMSINIAADPKAYEAQDVDFTTLPDDPKAFGLALQSAVAQTPDNAQDIVLGALDSMGDAVNTMDLGDSLPESGVEAALEEQLADALISRAEIESIQAQIDDLSTKYANALGLDSAEFNQIFSVTEESTETTSSELTDQQFEALYGFRQASRGIDFILSNDQLFDENADLINQRDSNNGSETVGSGVFAFPAEDGGTKEGIVPTGATLEDIALAELGDTNRWTEIAELNNLKAPYIDDSEDTGLTVTYKPRYRSFSDPSEIQDLQIGYTFIVTKSPAPVGAWAGKANQIAEYIGGDQTQAAAWRFMVPPDGAVAEVQETEELLQYALTDDLWVQLSSLDNLQQDGVLRPGDRILIPTETAPPPRTRIRGPRDNNVTNDLTNSEKALAVDLKLTNAGDLALDARGDVGVAYGPENGAQAVSLKLVYNKGSLTKFPNIGAGLGVGGKMPDLADVRQRVFSSLIQDDRIEDVQNILLVRENNTLNISFDVKFVELQDPIPITIPV